ncbi:hypothetical protein ABIC37_005815 [Priestia megaterium]|jgi:hypothetical protein|uniref:hypothetical protein n=1 Tax=Priestia megaterium TaxID=1404 RepID=UPI00047174C3|nr:hypothetical protein [Priestia megaterium]MCM3196506.1 hypothetical protein [Priestia megaterium]PFA93642.1 hypothetical protein CN383_28265 [Priestia megaterium]PFR87826.1 hypothetical protein COK39_27685 [Priestia megaterium]TCN05911.1 hypothetical protein EV581_11131 [Bacillus sp. BK006]
MKYNVRIYEDSQGMLMINVPDEIFLVIDLLLSDVQEDGSKLWLDLIDKVLSEQSSYEELTGNACTIEIKYDVTKIVNEYAEEDQKASCLIETTELKQILLMWDDAVKNKYTE